jgi:hypothetical protein
MGKINFVTVGPTDLNYSHIEWIFNKYFTFESYSPSKQYNKNNNIFVVSRLDHWHDNLIPQYLEQGYKLILANLWEARPYFLSNKFTPYLDNILVMLGCQTPYDYGWKNVVSIPRWFWLNESLWYTCESKLQYQKYIPQRNNSKLFFMPIRRAKKFRDRIVEKFAPYLDHSIYSYAEKWNEGRHLDINPNNPATKIRWDRVFEPSWYNDTYFSLVVETAVDRQLDLERERVGLRTEEYPCDLFVTEKTFKPIAFQHPFMVCGMQGTLQFLHDQGFETYDNIFDESYDSLPFFEDRLDVIYNNIVNFDRNKYYDRLTNEKIQHNYNLFYDRAKVLDYFIKDVINPIVEFNE